jgi:hypothetical protein
MTKKNQEKIQVLKCKKLNLKKKKLAQKFRNIHWARYYHLNTKNKRMSFDNRGFLTDIYKAIHKEQKVVMPKSVQCGVSEAFVVSHFEQAERGLAILYILPKTDLRNRFVDNRIDRTIIRVPKYREIMATSVGKTDSKSLKMFGQGVINYVASNSPANFTEFPADVIYYDEWDKMDQKSILLAKDRISDSEYKYERSVSQPTIEEFGISYEFERSSKGERFFKCPHCGEWQIYDFLKNVVEELGQREYRVLDKDYVFDIDAIEKPEVKIFCIKCHKVVPRFETKQVWVHEFPDREVKGFHVSKIFSPQGTIRDLVDGLMEAKDSEDKMMHWLNSELGVPMSGAGTQITRDEILASRGDYTLGPNMVENGARFAGIDVGKVLHTIVREWQNGKKKLVWKGKLSGGEQSVLNMMRDFNVRNTVIDAEPELNLVRNLKKMSGKIYNCKFHGNPEMTLTRKRDKINVRLRRTLCIDRIKENYARGIYLNPRDITEDKEYMKHMQSNVRIANDDGEFVWLQKTKRPDHYLLSEGYCDLAYELTAGNNIFEAYEKIVKQTEEKEAGMEAGSKIEDDMNKLPESEKERLKQKQQVDANSFFKQLQEQNML